MARLTDLGGAATQLLKLFAEQLVALGVELPCAQYVSPGQIAAWDSDSLVVTMPVVQQGQPGAPDGGTEYHPLYTAQFRVTLLRGVATIHGDGPASAMLPTPEAINTDGVRSGNDAGALIRAATNIREGYLFTSPGEGFNVGPCMAVGPAGALAGQQIEVTVSLS